MSTFEAVPRSVRHRYPVMGDDRSAKHIERPERSHIVNNAVLVLLGLLFLGALVAYFVLARG
jgi:hypothetical protein